MKRNIKIFVVFMMFSSCTAQKTQLKRNSPNPFSQYLSNQLDSSIVILLRNNDCQSCELAIKEFIQLYGKQDLYIIAQEIRPVEKKKFYLKNPYLCNKAILFDDTLRASMGEYLNISLKSTVAIGLDKNKKVYYYDYVRDFLHWYKLMNR